MNSELVEQIAAIIDGLAVQANDHEQNRLTTDEYMEELKRSTDRIIALVQQDIARRLLSDATVDAMEHKAKWPMFIPADGTIGPRKLNYARAEAALAAIGIEVEP